jgi:hypothetical protein
MPDMPPSFFSFLFLVDVRRPQQGRHVVVLQYVGSCMFASGLFLRKERRIKTADSSRIRRGIRLGALVIFREYRGACSSR